MPRYGPGPVYVGPRRRRWLRLLLLTALLEPRRNKPPKKIRVKVQRPKIRKPRKVKGGGKK